MALDSFVTLRLDDSEVAGEIHSPITAAMAAAVDKDWAPYLVEHQQLDAQWRWEQHIGECPEGHYKSFALICRERVEGLLIVAKERQMRGPLDPTLGAHMEYLASAPWNRKGPGGGPLVAGQGRVTPSGQVLVARAAILSKEEGHLGWLGWNSLPGDTIDWYRALVPGVKCDFPVVPVDETYQYFEMTPADADALLRRPPTITRK